MPLLNQPLEITKGRVRKFRFSVLDDNGDPLDIRNIAFVCDIKRKVGDTAIATLVVGDGIELDLAGEEDNVGDLVFAEDLFETVDIPTSSQAFPFINLIAELVYYPSDAKTELFKFPIRLYEEVTTSDV